MELHNNIPCVSYSELVDSGVMTSNVYKNLKRRNQINVVRRACRGVQVLIEYNSLPERYKQAFGVVCFLPDSVEIENKAYEFFSEYTFSNGKGLPVATQAKYRSNASALMMLHEILTVRKARGGSMVGVWSDLLCKANEVRQELGHTLPKEKRGLQRVYNAFANNYPNYESLVSGKFLNTAASKK